MTATMRFGGTINSDMKEINHKLIPYPRIHFMTPSISPLQSEEQAKQDNSSIEDLATAAFDK